MLSLFKKNQSGKFEVMDKLQSQASHLALEAQKMAKTGAITHAINDLKSKRAGIYTKIGEKYCELILNGEGNAAESQELAELIDGVKEVNDKITSSENEIAELENTFEQLAANNKRGSASAPSGAKCPGCGKEFIPGENLFCGGCGTDLRNVVTEQTCPNCQSKYDMEPRFCKTCGTKLKSDEEPAIEASEEVAEEVSKEVSEE